MLWNGFMKPTGVAAEQAGKVLKASKRFWLGLEAVPGGKALLTTWKEHVGGEMEAFRSLFLRGHPEEPADQVPCPWGCGCLHKVVAAEKGSWQGVCQCEPRRCETYRVQPEERIPLELDWGKMGEALCGAFGCRVQAMQLGVYNLRQIGAWSPEAVPVLLGLCTSGPELLHGVGVVTARLGQPFILLVPTGRHVGMGAKELLKGTGSGVFTLEEQLGLDEAGRLVCGEAPGKVFAEVTPLRPDPSAEEVARRTFFVLQAEEERGRRQGPTLYRVFDLYCVRNLPIRRVARQCGCSSGTVANRLKELRAKTGADPGSIRRVSPKFLDYQDNVREAARNYRRSSQRVD